MSPEARRIVIPLLVIAVALAVLAAYIVPRMTPPPPEAPVDPPVDPVPLAEPDAREPRGAAEPEHVPPQPADLDPPAEDRVALRGLRAAPPVENDIDADVDPSPVGSLDPREEPMLVEFSRFGAGISRITLSEHWLTATAARAARRHYASLSPGAPSPQDWEREMAEWRYVLAEEQPLFGEMIPLLAVHSVVINDESIGVFSTEGEDGQEVPAWVETAPGEFETTIVNEDEKPVLRITRAYSLHVRDHPRGADEGMVGDIVLVQRVQNLTPQTLEIRWRQFGPGDVALDRARYIDRRRFRFGYLLSPERDPQRRHVISDDNRLVLERTTVFRRFDEQKNYHLWPTARTQERGYELAWFATNNRYFALAMHPLLDEYGRGDRSLTDLVEEITYRAWPTRDTGERAEQANVFTYLYSPVHEVAPGQTLALDAGVYAGPLDRHVLSELEPFRALNMDHLVIYIMSMWCAVCTFQWLAHLLLAFLGLLHDYILFDWGLAIIGLVVVVRALLHPITKKAQINMMRFGKQMQAMKPEIDKLQAKHKDDPKRMQQEQIRLFREHGVNPFQILGCLPMFLQFPIWIALYAMLYFAFDIRHQPAFFGVFQLLGNWPFLADLSTGDHFFGEFHQPYTLWFWHLTGLNLLPILMGVVLFMHQKYMTPPPSPNMTPEQIQQQRIMRVMFVVMLPVFLYNAPAGLTMYIMTSSIIGIIESRYVRAHVDKADLEPAPATPKKAATKKRKKPRDRQTRAYIDAMDRAKEKGKPKRGFKKKRK